MFVIGTIYFKSSLMVKMSFFMCFSLLFWPKSLDAVAMATEVELDELTLDFLFLRDH